jgi:hypothetical protein
MTTPLDAHWRSLYQNRFLGCWNLYVNGRYVTARVTIERITREEVTMEGGRKTIETLLYFRGKRTPLILTRKMGKVLANMYGVTMNGWLNQTITLYVEQGFRTREGKADVLRIRNDRAGEALKRQLAGEDEERAAEPPEVFADGEMREPGEEG